eukprot:3840088-Rhodomonas_salina.1
MGPSQLDDARGTGSGGEAEGGCGDSARIEAADALRALLANSTAHGDVCGVCLEAFEDVAGTLQAARAAEALSAQHPPVGALLCGHALRVACAKLPNQGKRFPGATFPGPVITGVRFWAAGLKEAVWHVVQSSYTNVHRDT